MNIPLKKWKLIELQNSLILQWHIELKKNHDFKWVKIYATEFWKTAHSKFSKVTVITCVCLCVWIQLILMALYLYPKIILVFKNNINIVKWTDQDPEENLGPNQRKWWVHKTAQSRTIHCGKDWSITHELND